MLFLRLWNYIRGYVIILVEGYFIEKFINICTHRQIYLWDIKRREKSGMSLKIGIKGFKTIRPVAHKAKCRVRIISKRGMPFVFSKYRRRKTFIAGAVIFIALIYILTSFIWAIEVSGNKNISTDLVLEKLAHFGIKPGTLKYKIDPDQVVNAMMLEVRELSWISVNIKGTKVKVELTERTKPPELVPKQKPCDIVAARDGVIQSIMVLDGVEAVKVGDTVTKGQLLISGTIENKNQQGKYRQVHSMGTVTARTWYEDSSLVITNIVEKKRTDQTKENYYLLLFGKKIGLFPGSIEYENYDKIEIKKELSIGENLVFPFGLVIDRYHENILNQREISLEDAIQIAGDMALKKAEGSVPKEAQIIKRSISIVDKADGQKLAVATIECLEEIGVTKEIGFTEEIGGE